MEEFLGVLLIFLQMWYNLNISNLKDMKNGKK